MNLLNRILINSKRDENGCLIYTGALAGTGYPYIWHEGKSYKVARLIKYLLHDFDLNSPLHILHKNHICKSKACIEDDHLYIGDRFDNMQDMQEFKGHTGFIPGNYNTIKTHCGTCGKELSGNNLIIEGKSRRCKNCKRARGREYYHRNK